MSSKVDRQLALADLIGAHTLTGWGMFDVGRNVSAADWVINDIRIGGQSQFAAGGDLPGDLFATTAVDSIVDMGPVQTNQDFQMIVTYVGSRPEGASFHAAVIGTNLEAPELAAGRHVLPMSSGNVLIPPGHSAQIVARPQGVAFRPERIQIAGTSAQRHLLLRLDGILHDFVKGGGIARPNATDADLGDEESVIDPPLVIEFRLFGEGPMLWGVDELTGTVVLEIGSIVRTEQVTHYDWVDTDDEDYDGVDAVADEEILDEGHPTGHTVERVEQVKRREHFCRFDSNGFTPTWWPLLEAAAP